MDTPRYQHINDEEFSDCVTCKHKTVDWDEEPCISCTNLENHYEPIKEKR